MYRKFCVIFPNFTPPNQGLFMSRPEILAVLYRAVSHMLPAKYQPNRPGGSGVEVI